MDIEGSSFHLDTASPERSCLGDSRLSELNLTLPFKSPTSENELGRLDRRIDSTFECDPEDFGNIPPPSQIIPSGLETLVNTRDVAGNVSWTSSMATPLSKNVTYSNLNTEERRIFLPSEDCASALKRRSLFTPDLSDTTLLNETTETPKGLRMTKTGVGRTLLVHQEDYSLRSNSLLPTPKKSDEANLELSSKRKSSETLSPIVSKKRLKMQRNRNRNKMVGSPEPADESTQNHTTVSMDMFNDSEEDIFSEFENASSTPSRSASEKAESSTSSVDKNPKSTTADCSKNESGDLEETLTEEPPKVGWSPDDSFSEEMVKAFTDFEENPVVSELRSRVQYIKEASSGPSLLYDETASAVSKSSVTAQDILKSMTLQGKYNDSKPAKLSSLRNDVQRELVPFSQLQSVVNQVKPITSTGGNKITEKSDVTPLEELSILTDQQLIEAGEEAEMLLLLEHEDDWLRSNLDQCTDNSKTEDVQSDDGFKTASGKDVIVSQEAIDRANKLLADVGEDFTSCEKDAGSFPFAGKRVSDSQKAPKLSNVDENNVTAELSQGFRTANGHSIAVLQDALERARTLLVDEDDYQPKKRKFAEFEEVGFATASGKIVEVSQEALEKARRLLDDVDDGGSSKRMKAEDGVTLDDLCLELENMEDDGLDGQVASNCRRGLSFKENMADNEAALKGSRVLNSSLEGNEVQEGFTTASGKMVSISESALQKVKKLFVDEVSTVEDIVADTQKLRLAVATSRSGKFGQKSTESGFATASGKKVAISNSALEKAKKMFADEESTFEDIVTDTQKLKSAVGLSRGEKSGQKSTERGFATASGKQVAISRSALEKAKKMLADEESTFEDIVTDTQKLKSAVGLSRGGKSSQTLTNGGFATASGKKVAISSSALEKAKKMLADEESTFEDIVTDTQKLKSAVAISRGEKSSQKSTESGFATASGKKVAISSSALEKAKKMLADEESTFEDIVAYTQKLKSAVGLSRGGKSSQAPTNGFATASGKKVAISSSALEKAKKMLADEESTFEDIVTATQKLKTAVGLSRGEKSSQTPTNGFATASGKKVAISSSALEKAKKMFADEESTFEDIVAYTQKRKSAVALSRGEKSSQMPTDVGFATASGKKVPISSSALEKVKELFADEDSTEEDLVKLAAESKMRRSAMASPAIGNTKSVMSEFATASGKKVSISVSALEKATKLLAKDDTVDKDPSRLLEDGEMKRNEETVLVDISGFSTASGKDVTISNSALEKARKLFDDESADVEDLSDLARSLGNRKVRENGASVRSPKDCSILSEGDSSKFGSLSTEEDLNQVGFATASGNVVSVSDESLKKARLLLQDDDENSSVFGDEICLSPTVGGAKRREVLRRVENDGFKVPFAVKKESPKMGLRAFDGFSTASGRSVCQKAQAILERMDQEDADPSVESDGSSAKAWSEKDKSDRSQNTVTSLSPIEPIVTISPTVFQESATVNQSLNSSGTINKTLSQEILESTAAFLADESENSFDFPMCGMVEPSKSLEPVTSLKRVTSIEPVTSEPSEPEDRVNAPEAVTVFPEDCSPIVAPSSPILGDRSINSRRKSRKKIGGRLSLSVSVAGKSSTPTAKKDSRANTSLPATSSVESPVPVRSEEEQRKVWEEDEDDEMLTNLEIDDVISGLKTEAESGVSGRELRPEVSEARKRAAEEQERVVKGGITCKKGPKMAKGSLFAAKSAAASGQRSLKMFVGSETPGPGNRDELRRLGVGPWVCNVTSENAIDFRFNAWDFYSADVCLENVFGLPVGDGARLILNDEGTAGVAEIERAFLASESVDPALVPTGWVRNHYRWIVWKLASLERRFPKHFSRVLSPHIVMQQLKYRYDREIDRCQRPALRRIVEHDDSAARRMVTCVASIKKVEGEAGIPQMELELTDGWYSMFALIDKELQSRVLKGRVAPGTKLITHGAELLNCPQGCPPLEIGADVRLKITSNSCRRACWSAKLGFQRDPRPFRIPLQSVLANGGMVGCVRVYVARIYPLIYLEKNEKARTVVRSERAERREAAQAEVKRQKAAEKLYVQMQAEVQHNQPNPTKTTRHVTRQLVARANTSQELCSLMESAIDPVAFENMLSDEQKALVLDLQREKQESLSREVQSKVKQRLEEKSIPQRNVTPVLKVRLVDGKNPDSDSSATLSIWHPPEEMAAMFKENQLFTMYSLTVNGWRAGVLQLSATRASQYHQEADRGKPIPCSLVRTLTPLSELYTRKFSPAFGEVDTVGVVFRVDPLPQLSRSNHETPGRAGSQYQSVYLADHEQNVVGVSFWGGLKEFGVDDIIKVGIVLSMASLQWRGGSLKGPISLYAQEVSVFTLNPRQQKLRDAIQSLQKVIKPDVASYVKSCEEKLEDLLKSATPYKMHANSPNNDVILQGGDSPSLGLSTPKQVPVLGKVSTSLADVQHSPLASALYSPVVQERLKKLDIYGDAPPLPPIVMAQRRSSLRRGFRPPRRTLDTSATKISSSDITNS